jgi:hypothetical protein
MSLLIRIWEGHQQAFLMSMVVTLCYMPMTIGLSVFKLVNFGNPIYSFLILGVILLLTALVCPLLVTPCARAFGFTFTSPSDSIKVGKEISSNP